MLNFNEWTVKQSPAGVPVTLPTSEARADIPKLKIGYILMALCWNVTLRPPVNKLKAGALSARQNGLLMLAHPPSASQSQKQSTFVFPSFNPK